MRPASSRFLTALAAPHVLAVEVAISSPAGPVTVPLIDGTVTLDQRAATRGRCELTLQQDEGNGLELIPTSSASLLAPYGAEATVSRGVLFPDGTSELVSLGVFRLEVTDTEDDPSGQSIRVSGQDRSSIVIDARFEEPYQVAAGTNYTTAIGGVLAAGYPGIVTDLPATSLTTPNLVAQEGDDRWSFAQSMAKAMGHELYFDGDGVCVMVPTSTLSSGSAVTTIAEGQGGVLLRLGSRWSREGTYNRVIAVGENTGEGPPVRGVATDENPLSPTYYYGPFGRVPRFYASPFVTTDVQAQDAAAAILAGELGTTQQLEFGSVVNPALEPGDVARVTRARSGVDEDHIIDSLTIPLTPAGTMTGSTRATQVT
ncbi:MAG: DUF5047 domain-containing protein [Gemmatimonadetes bacterium]|nr:DUF5047 domain-containing protein [Gemmatimonadota bacterium]